MPFYTTKKEERKENNKHLMKKRVIRHKKTTLQAITARRVVFEKLSQADSNHH